jgi:uncharacterized membrane protein YphA (DoxX/SURF4 family)
MFGAFGLSVMLAPIRLCDDWARRDPGCNVQWVHETTAQAAARLMPIWGKYAMRPNPLDDVVQFLTRPAWFTAVFWLLLLASIVIAILAWRRDPEQRTPRNVGIWGLRMLMGAMWWQQTLWKIPPNFDGLRFWMQQEAEHAAIPLQATLVGDVVLPNLWLFGPLVYLVELAIAVSLLLGLLSRAGALLGLLMGLNLWLGLYSAPGEWPWTYMFLVMIQAFFVIDPPGRLLGADVLLCRRAVGGMAPITTPLSWVA